MGNHTRHTKHAHENIIIIRTPKETSAERLRRTNRRCRENNNTKTLRDSMNYYLLLYYNYYELQCSANNSNARSELYRFFICIICIYVLFQLTVSFACKTHQSRNYCHFAKCCVFSTHAQAAGPNRLLSQCVE